MAKLNLGLPSYEDSIFSTQQERDALKAERVTKIPIAQIRDFEGHPFSVVLDDDMKKLMESIQTSGMNTPAIVRPAKDGNGYEMIAGHRRKFALNQLGISDMDVIIRNYDDDDAVIHMVDTNIQRETIKPTERGYAYKMRLDAMVHQGKKKDFSGVDVGVEYNSTSRQLGEKYASVTVLASQLNESERQIQRFIRLTYLNKDLQQMVDKTHPEDITIAFNPAVELSFLNLDEQNDLTELILEKLATPSLAQCQDFKKKSKEGVLTKSYMDRVLSLEKPNQRETINIPFSETNEIYPKDITPRERRLHLKKLWKIWKNSTEYEKDIKEIRDARKKSHER